MPLFSSRKKLVTYRLSLEEYEAVRSLCISRGVRSISELTRDAVLQQLSTDRISRNIASGNLISLMSALEQIDVLIKDLSGRISNVLGSTSSNSRSTTAS